MVRRPPLSATIPSGAKRRRVWSANRLTNPARSSEASPVWTGRLLTQPPTRRARRVTRRRPREHTAHSRMRAHGSGASRLAGRGALGRSAAPGRASIAVDRPVEQPVRSKPVGGECGRSALPESGAGSGRQHDDPHPGSIDERARARAGAVEGARCPHVRWPRQVAMPRAPCALRVMTRIDAAARWSRVAHSPGSVIARGRGPRRRARAAGRRGGAAPAVSVPAPASR